MKIKILIISILTLLSFPYLQAKRETINHNNLDLQIAEFTKAFVRKSIEAWVAADIIKEYNKIIERCDYNEIFFDDFKNQLINILFYYTSSDLYFLPDDKLCHLAFLDFKLSNETIGYSNILIKVLDNFFKNLPNKLSIKDIDGSMHIVTIEKLEINNNDINDLSKNHIQDTIIKFLNTVDLTQINEMNLFEEDIAEQILIMREYVSKYLKFIEQNVKEIAMKNKIKM